MTGKYDTLSPSDPLTAPEIIVIADGWRKSTFEKLLNEGNLEEIQDCILDNGVFIENVVSNIPSVSIASHASILTGSFQDEHRIPGHRWQSADCSCCRNYLSLLGSLKVNRDLSKDVSTFFEDAPIGAARIAIQSIIRRGADIRSTLLSQKAAPILGKLGDLAIENPASRIVAWLPRGDSLSHIHGPDSNLVAEEMKETSREIGKLAARLQAAGIWEQAKVLIVPDHGHRSVEYHTSLRRVAKQFGLDLSVNPKSVSKDRPVARTSGDSAAYIYLPARVKRFSDEIAKYFVDSPEVSMACLREENVARIFTENGNSEMLISDTGDIRYRLFAGTDPLNITQDFSPLVFMNGSTPSMGAFPDFLHQYSKSHVDSRSAELLLFAAEGTHFGVTPRLGWRFGFHQGTHGGPSSDEVVVSAAYKGDTFIDGSRPIRSADLLATLGLKSMGVKKVDS